MKTYLHLCNNQTDDSVMWQILNADFNLTEGNSFTYTENMYQQLENDNKIIFDRAGLKIGNYKVQSVWTESNEVWGELRILYLRPE